MKIKITIFILSLITFCFLYSNCNKIMAFSAFPEAKKNFDGRFTQFYIFKAENSISQGDYLGAKDSLTKAVKFEPGNAELHMELGLIYEIMANYYGAELEYKTVLDLDPSNKRVNYYLGLVLDRLGKIDESIDYLAKSVELMPDSPFIYYDIGVIYAKNKSYEKSIYFSQKAVDLKPDFAEAYNNLCYGQANTGHFNDALYNCQNRYILSPENAATLDSMGYVYYGLKDYDKAIDYYKKALAIDNGISEVYLHLAQAYKAAGKKIEAAENYEKYLKLEPKADNIKEIKHTICSLKNSNGYKKTPVTLLFLNIN